MVLFEQLNKILDFIEIIIVFTIIIQILALVKLLFTKNHIEKWHEKKVIGNQIEKDVFPIEEKVEVTKDDPKELEVTHHQEEVSASK